MLRKGREITAGVFDSAILRKNQSKSAPRTTVCYELELFHTASGVSHVDGRAYPIKRGMLLCAKPGQERFSHFPVRCSFIRIALPQGEDGELQDILQTLPVCTYIEDAEKRELLLGQLARLSALCLSEAEDGLAQVKINRLFWDILYRCMTACRQEEQAAVATPGNRIVLDACEYIREHYTSNGCTLQTIADAVGISRNRLHALFRQITGKTPFAYILNLRIEQAKRLIAAGEKTMAEIAAETGFCSQSHFTKAFRGATGETPRTYGSRLWEQY